MHIAPFTFFFSQNLNGKRYISSITKLVSLRLGALYRPCQFFSPSQFLFSNKGLVRPCMEYASHVCRGFTHTSRFDRVKSKDLRLVALLLLTIFQSSNSVSMLHFFLFFIVIFMLTALLHLPTACLPPPTVPLHPPFY